MGSLPFARRAAAVVMGAALIACRDRPVAYCIRGPLPPLTIGDTVRVTGGTLASDSDCSPAEGPAFTWSVEPGEVATIDARGLVTARTPGAFVVSAQTGQSVVTRRGYVLSPDWRARIFPISATIHVGDSIDFRVRARDSAGTDVPDVPFVVSAPEFSRSQCDSAIVRPCSSLVSADSAGAAATFLGVREGRTAMIGRIGRDSAVGSLRVIARTDTTRR